MTQKFVVFVKSFTAMSCHIGTGMGNLCKFVEDFVALLGAITDRMDVKTRLWFELENKQLARQVFNKNIKHKINGLWTFGVVLYRY